MRRGLKMLAYNENGELAEFEEHGGVAVCKFCKQPYHRYETEQVPGFRIKDYDICPYCGKENGSSMEWEYSNRKMTDDEIKQLKAKQ